MFVQANCGKAPSATQKWKFVAARQSAVAANMTARSKLVHIVHEADGLCLTQRVQAASSRIETQPIGRSLSIMQHNQFELAKCDATAAAAAYQLWLIEQSSANDSAITITSTVDRAFRVNVGEGSSPQNEKEFQLWRPCFPADQAYEKSIGYSNKIFKLDAAGGGALRVKFGTVPFGSSPSYTDCVDVCEAGSTACGGQN
eukprot:SAG22_NODE_932_length_6448_cov_7.053709_3_plen_200_part_00